MEIEFVKDGGKVLVRAVGALPAEVAQVEVDEEALPVEKASKAKPGALETGTKD